MQQWFYIPTRRDIIAFVVLVLFGTVLGLGVNALSPRGLDMRIAISSALER